ncbi:MAG: hypothetical protein HYY40_10985 [Bacteroidetes bacterium]|nr:hypothetical protein [Bacteroidota bacterium]
MFKNGRKDFFRNTNRVRLDSGDYAAVEASPGHDIGLITLTGESARQQLIKRNIPADSPDLKIIYRKAHDNDIRKWMQAKEREPGALAKAREIAASMNLQMKISDVEFQGDNNKTTIYFTADGRVDFRELIRALATEFRVRIEMRQVGLRQEAGRLGGIGDCGRELCCSTWLTDFKAVSTTVARNQRLSINPEKLTGQCGKLKCCLNYELDFYTETLAEFPDTGTPLQTQKGDAYHQKTDVFRKMVWYGYRDSSEVPALLTLQRIKEIIEMNRQGQKPPELKEEAHKSESAPAIPRDTLLQDSVSRFDNKLNRDKNRSGHQHKRKHGH